jgi:hypothetical protein
MISNLLSSGSRPLQECARFVWVMSQAGFRKGQLASPAVPSERWLRAQRA